MQRPGGELKYPPPVCVSLAAVMVIVLFRYAHVIEKHQNCILNTAGLSTGWICAAGLIMVGNFQVLPLLYFLIEDIILMYLICRHLSGYSRSKHTLQLLQLCCLALESANTLPAVPASSFLKCTLLVILS